MWQINENSLYVRMYVGTYICMYIECFKYIRMYHVRTVYILGMYLRTYVYCVYVISPSGWRYKDMFYSLCVLSQGDINVTHNILI